MTAYAGCDCDLRHRQWNGFGRCLACGRKYESPVARNESTPIIDLVTADLKQRAAVGVNKYGALLQANNGRDALRDAYEEALDLAMYLRQEIENRKKP